MKRNVLHATKNTKKRIFNGIARAKHIIFPLSNWNHFRWHFLLKVLILHYTLRRKMQLLTQCEIVKVFYKKNQDEYKHRQIIGWVWKKRKKTRINIKSNTDQAVAFKPPREDYLHHLIHIVCIMHQKKYNLMKSQIHFLEEWGTITSSCCIGISEYYIHADFYVFDCISHETYCFLVCEIGGGGGGLSVAQWDPDCLSTGRTSYPASGAWFITKNHFICPLSPA